MLAFVIDVGLFMMIRSQLANAADAAALAGIMAWNPTKSDAYNANLIATNDTIPSYVSINSGIINNLSQPPLQLCKGGVQTSPFIKSFQKMSFPNNKNAPAVTVTLKCEAGVVFGLILWEGGSAPTYMISADATAMQGCIDSNGNVVALESTCSVTPPPNQPAYGARLIPTPS
jgi:Flp pilus assembly protein TadG